jgi:hypothetical protein
MTDDSPSRCHRPAGGLTHGVTILGRQPLRHHGQGHGVAHWPPGAWNCGKCSLLSLQSVCRSCVSNPRSVHSAPNPLPRHIGLSSWPIFCRQLTNPLLLGLVSGPEGSFLQPVRVLGARQHYQGKGRAGKTPWTRHTTSTITTTFLTIEWPVVKPKWRANSRNPTYSTSKEG